jgi:hypothetical protein
VLLLNSPYLLRDQKGDVDCELQSEREDERRASFVEPSRQSGIRRESRSNLEVIVDAFERDDCTATARESRDEERGGTTSF